MEHVPSFRDQLQNGIYPSWQDGLVDTLYHHGIKGMHWGVRRPRNEDGILQGAGKGLFKKMKANRQRNKQAKADYKAAKNKAKKDFQDWANKADAKYNKDAQYKKSGQLGRDAEKAVDRYNSARKSAKAKYKQTVNADKINKLEQKRAKAQRAAGRDSAIRKQINRNNIVARTLLAPTSAVARTSQAYNQHRANKAQRRIRRLSN